MWQGEKQVIGFVRTRYVLDHQKKGQLHKELSCNRLIYLG